MFFALKNNRYSANHFAYERAITPVNPHDPFLGGFLDF